MKQEKKAFRVLIVDDYKSNTVIAGAYLDKFGYEHDVCVTGLEAIEKATSGLYDAVLMDIQMPTMDGIEATMHIRNLERQCGRSPVPIIATTSHFLVADRDTCLNAGMDHYMVKPFDPQELQTVLIRLVQDGNNFATPDFESRSDTKAFQVG